MVNPEGTITESNYSNNSITKQCHWIGLDGISAYEFIATDGEYSFPTNTPHSFTFTVANFGDNIVEDITVGILLNTSMNVSIVLEGQLPPGYVRSGSVSLGFATSGSKIVGMIVDPFEEIADPTREDNQKMVDVLVRDGTDGQIVQNRIENKLVPVVSTDHGLTLIDFTLDWQEHYHIVGSNAIFTKRQGYVIAGSSRPLHNTPYTVLLMGERHETSSGSTLRTFSMSNYNTYFPTEQLIYYAKQNTDLVTYPASNTNRSGFGVGIVGDDAVYATSFTHFVSLNVS